MDSSDYNEGALIFGVGIMKISKSPGTRIIILESLISFLMIKK